MGPSCRDRMVVGCKTTNAISAYHHWSCELEFRSSGVYSIQYYVIKFFSDFREVGGFLSMPVSATNKTVRHDILIAEIVLKVENTIGLIPNPYMRDSVWIFYWSCTETFCCMQKMEHTFTQSVDSEHSWCVHKYYCHLHLPLSKIWGVIFGQKCISSFSVRVMSFLKLDKDK